jgi:hypothetical protein
MLLAQISVWVECFLQAVAVTTHGGVDFQTDSSGLQKYMTV